MTGLPRSLRPEKKVEEVELVSFTTEGLSAAPTRSMKKQVRYGPAHNALFVEERVNPAATTSHL